MSAIMVPDVEQAKHDDIFKSDGLKTRKIVLSSVVGMGRLDLDRDACIAWIVPRL